MKPKKLTRQRLEYLLKNWGTWERSIGRVGPGARVVCGSAEARYAGDAERYVWEGTANVPRETPDDPQLAERTEEILVRIPVHHQRMIVARYAREYSLQLLAAKWGMSQSTAEAQFEAALAAIWLELEETTWASGL